LIDGNKALEINTRRLEDASVRPPLLKLYSRFRELGGKYATLGSDAHYTQHIGRAFNVAEEMANQCGLHIVHFEKRKMIVDK
jgi:histidinol-phosphatase (PHP family)